jgi:flagellar motor switch protein FliM
MQLVNWLCQRGLPPLSMPSAAPDLEGVAQRLRRQTEIAELVYAVTSPQAAGLVRIFVPADMVRNMEVFVAEAARRDRSRKRLMLTRLGQLRATLTASVGVVGLTGSELGSLEAGDIVLLGEHGLRSDGLDRKDGFGRLTLGRSSGHYLSCELRRSHDRWQVEICDATPKPNKPRTKNMQGDEMSTEKTDQAGTDKATSRHSASTGVLDKTEVDVEIRVGAMPLPVSMLAEVQSGYVLEMDRRVDDGVDLVVDGQVVGRGELVNVDGKLGVRVLSIED